MLSCHDNFEANFDNYPSMLSYHQALSMASSWHRCKVKDLHVEPLDSTSPLYGHPSAFAAGTSEEAIEDTAANLGLALNVDGNIYPVRSTAYKTLIERAKVGGTALPKLSRKDLANVLNSCLSVHNSDALLLIRNEKISAAHSGDDTDYSVLPMDELLVTLERKLSERFPGFLFEGGYTDHSYTSCSWILPNQKEGILGAYTKALAAHGQTAIANRLVPGIRFLTSDTGLAAAKVSALLLGTQHPINIGDCIGVDHRNQRKVADFEAEMDKLFAKFCDSVAKLQSLLEIPLEYPVNAMTRVCKKLSLPKKEALEAIAMYEMAYGGGPATAHDVFMAMQEIPYILKTRHTPEAKMLKTEENMARALSIRWSDYDLAKELKW